VKQSSLPFVKCSLNVVRRTTKGSQDREIVVAVGLLSLDRCYIPLGIRWIELDHGLLKRNTLELMLLPVHILNCLLSRQAR
jgi:hypothetical protein